MHTEEERINYFRRILKLDERTRLSMDYLMDNEDDFETYLEGAHRHENVLKSLDKAIDDDEILSWIEIIQRSKNM